MSEMRQKLYPGLNTSFNIKKSSGGLADIDFILSFMFLINPELLVERKEKRISNSFELMMKTSFTKINFDQLEINYYSLKQIELTNQYLFNSRLSKMPNEENKLKKISKECGFSNSKLFLDKLNEIILQTKRYYQTIFN